MRESDREKFIRLANKRVSNALKAIDLIGNLSNKSNYDYSDSDVVKIFRALNEEIQRAKTRFETASGKKEQKKFKLS